MSKIRGRWPRAIVLAVVVFSIVAPTASLPVTAAPIPNVVYVATNGSDVAGCGEIDAPCRTIQQAVDIAVSFDEIRVAEGVYHYADASLPAPCYAESTSPAVICILNKELRIVGGYSTDNWSTSNPTAHPTIIDGQNQYRGVLLQRTGPTDPAASLYMSGFTIQNGLASGRPNLTGTSTFGFGGGMLADCSPLVLKDMIFQNNKAVGGDTSYGEYGGTGAGGGLALRASPSGVIENVTFEGNQAIGGVGQQRGGLAIGGGCFIYRSTVDGAHLVFHNNMALGGDANGYGIAAYEKADAQGGGFAIHESPWTGFEDVTITSNQARGGGSSSTYAGGGFGGGVMIQGAGDHAFLIEGALIADNLALGGNALNGGLGHGGGLLGLNSTVTIQRSHILRNTARGGDGTSGEKGGGGGGGLNFGRLDQSNSTVSIHNSVIADNAAEQGTSGTETGGGGGGIWFFGLEGEVVHSTIARNRHNSIYTQGQAAVILTQPGYAPAHIRFENSIVEGHVSQPGVAAVHVQATNQIELMRTLWVNNIKNTNLGELGAGVIVDENPIYADSAGFVSPGVPDDDYRLRDDSPAIDQAVDSSTMVDIDGIARPVGVAADLGAHELIQLRLDLGALRADHSLTLFWSIHPSPLPAIDHYHLTVACGTEANPPNEVACGQTIDVGMVSSFALTGLTNGSPYTVEIVAHDGGHTVLLESQVTATPCHVHRIFLPAVFNSP